MPIDAGRHQAGFIGIQGIAGNEAHCGLIGARANAFQQVEALLVAHGLVYFLREGVLQDDVVAGERHIALIKGCIIVDVMKSSAGDNAGLHRVQRLQVQHISSLDFQGVAGGGALLHQRLAEFGVIRQGDQQGIGAGQCALEGKGAAVISYCIGMRGDWLTVFIQQLHPYAGQPAVCTAITQDVITKQHSAVNHS